MTRKSAAICERNRRRARLWFLQELLADPAIDAVYNPLPNSLHAEWSIRACEAGKHVLCEKPLAVTGSEARAMFAAARRHGVALVEGFPYRAQPHALKLRELVTGGAIGRVQTMHAAFDSISPTRRTFGLIRRSEAAR